MFDIGFWELTLIMIVALLVIGPDRLPGLARKAGILVGKARRMVDSVREDINRELADEELRRIIKTHHESESDYDILEETREVLDDAKRELEAAKQEYLVQAIPDEDTGTQPSAATDAGHKTQTTEPLKTENIDEKPKDRAS